MKVLITESQLNNAIERLIKSVNQNVVSVQFSDKKTNRMAPDTGKFISYDKTIIKIVLDPHNILGGNIHTINSIDYLDHRLKIKNALNRFMNIDITKFMSPYDIEYYVIGTIRV